ncbi:hypothetical protein F5884DRAFT_842696 [Xylogone sp. PMI_703]|nr:hypothetical protein F5884DRAFT_842696 [Xylogone sp. PMI_703]
MESIKETVQNVTQRGSESQSQSQFATATTQQQEHPGLEKHMDPKPTKTHLPTEDEGYELYKPAGKLAGKKALITGGDSGIGRAIAILFAMEGASIAIAYLPAEEDDAQHTKSQVEKNGGHIHLFQTDLTHANNCKDLVQKSVDALGGLNILVNNAAKYALPHLKSSDTIINTASVDAYVGTGPALDYISSEGAIVAFTRALSNQQAGKGIRVNAVVPSAVWTPLAVSSIDEESLSKFRSSNLIRRPSQPNEIITCYVFLTSKDNSFMSSQVLYLNGRTIVNR